ncbi:MAG: sensor histidine kinase [Anaerolineae bacterium]|jgi:two-component system OmpR family sensor kinase|nr:HAMP domain-containing protein [Chloroflexota bacterium]
MTRHSPVQDRPHQPAASTRVRILGSYMGILAVALVFSLLLLFTVLYLQESEEIDLRMTQVVDELERLSADVNPYSGQPFGNDLQTLFDVYLSRTAPSPGDAYYALIGGLPYASSVTPAQLLRDPNLVAQWAALAEPTRAEVETPYGRIRYLAIPVVPQQGTPGLFVAVNFLDSSIGRLQRTVRMGGLVFAGVFAIVSLVAWYAAGRVLRPIRLLTEAAREIEDTRWSQRIPVHGDDEIAHLTATFNAMLDRLESAFQTQRRFIDDAGHELRTPITIVRGHLELASPEAGDWPEVRALVLDELDRMSRMVEDLLLLARSEQPAFLVLHPLDVDAFTAEVFAKVAALSAERQWRLAEAAPLVLRADRDRLTQALMNLARNAVENSPAGSCITLASRREGRSVAFSVQDEGRGVTQEERQRIFDRFARGSAGTRNAGGVGLGLAIVKTIAEAHGGHVQVDSAPGQGATFTLYLPTDQQEASP